MGPGAGTAYSLVHVIQFDGNIGVPLASSLMLLWQLTNHRGSFPIVEIPVGPKHQNRHSPLFYITYHVHHDKGEVQYIFLCDSQ